MKRTRATKPADPGKESSLEELRRHRIVRVKRQNEHLALNLKKAKGELVSADDLKREVIAANQTVKTQLLSLPFQLAPKLVNLPEQKAIQQILYEGLVACLNDLAYSREQPPPPDVCPHCGLSAGKDAQAGAKRK